MKLTRRKVSRGSGGWNLNVSSAPRVARRASVRDLNLINKVRWAAGVHYTECFCCQVASSTMIHSCTCVFFTGNVPFILGIEPRATVLLYSRILVLKRMYMYGMYCTTSSSWVVGETLSRRNEFP